MQADGKGSSGAEGSMGIAMTIVSGLIAISIIAVIGDVIAKGFQAKGRTDPAALKVLSDRIELLERQAIERESRVARLEAEIAFTTKLLEGKK